MRANHLLSRASLPRRSFSRCDHRLTIPRPHSPNSFHCALNFQFFPDDNSFRKRIRVRLNSIVLITNIFLISLTMINLANTVIFNHCARQSWDENYSRFFINRCTAFDSANIYSIVPRGSYSSEFLIMYKISWPLRIPTHTLILQNIL